MIQLPSIHLCSYEQILACDQDPILSEQMSVHISSRKSHNIVKD